MNYYYVFCAMLVSTLVTALFVIRALKPKAMPLKAEPTTVGTLSLKIECDSTDLMQKLGVATEALQKLAELQERANLHTEVMLKE